MKYVPLDFYLLSHILFSGATKPSSASSAGQLFKNLNPDFFSIYNVGQMKILQKLREQPWCRGPKSDLQKGTHQLEALRRVLAFSEIQISHLDN